MDYNKHSFINLLQVTGLDAVLQDKGLEFFFELHRALGHDDENPEVSNVFKGIKTPTDKLLTDDGQTLHDIIEEWSLAVMKPFIKKRRKTTSLLGRGYQASAVVT